MGIQFSVLYCLCEINSCYILYRIIMANTFFFFTTVKFDGFYNGMDVFSSFSVYILYTILHYNLTSIWLILFKLKFKVRENMGDFWKACMYLSISFPATACPPTFTKQTYCTPILKKMQSTSLKYNIEYQALYRSNFRSMGALLLVGEY